MATLPVNSPIPTLTSKHNHRLVTSKISLFRAVLVLFVVVSLGSCTKIKSTDIGAGLLPDVDRVLTFDTLLPVVTTNYLFGDSALPRMARTYTGAVSEHALGAITNDPMFGTTRASIFMELKPDSYKYYFENKPDSLSLDSVVLCLSWTRTWGDTNALQRVGVYALDEKMRVDSTYPITSNFAYSKKLGEATFAPSSLDDSVYLTGQTLVRQLRIKLSNEFGNQLLKADSTDGQPYASDSLFREYFKGFAIVPETTGGGAQANAIMTFALSDTNTHLALYYKFQKLGDPDTTSRKFKFNNSTLSAYANRIIRDRTGSDMERHLKKPVSGDSLLYIQTSPGSYATVTVPSLAGFKAAKGNVMVHLAELVVDQVPSANQKLDDILSPPPLLYLDFYDTTNKNQLPFLNDAVATGSYDPSLFGGILGNAPNAGLTPYAQYRIFITRHIQGIITRNSPNPIMYLYAPYQVSYSNLSLSFNVNPIAYGRVRLGGGNHSSKRMRLRIVYTKI
jgi:hypothetical protein